MNLEPLGRPTYACFPANFHSYTLALLPPPPSILSLFNPTLFPAWRVEGLPEQYMGFGNSMASLSITHITACGHMHVHV